MADPTAFNTRVEQDEPGSRFVIRTEQGVAELKYNVIGQQIVLEHTEVPKKLEGHGLAGSLAKAGLEYARAGNLSVIPVCPFVISYLKRHPEYQALVKHARFAPDESP